MSTQTSNANIIGNFRAFLVSLQNNKKKSFSSCTNKKHFWIQKQRTRRKDKEKRQKEDKEKRRNNKILSQKGIGGTGEVMTSHAELPAIAS